MSWNSCGGVSWEGYFDLAWEGLEVSTVPREWEFGT